MPNYVAIPKLKIDGQYASGILMEDMMKIVVEESLHLPSMFSLMIRNDYESARAGEDPWLYDDKFKIGTAIEIGFDSSTTDDAEFDDPEQGTVMKGEITAIEAHFNAKSQAPVVVRGYDVSHRLHRGRYNRSFQNMKDSDIVKQLIGEAGLAAGTIDETGGPYGFGDPVGHIYQENQTNMEFLRERAARNGYEFFVQDGKANFRKPTSGESLTLTWLRDISNFQVRVSSAEQVSSVEVRGWDYSKKTPIISTKDAQNSEVITTTEQGKGKNSSTAFSSSPKMIVVGQPVSSKNEADRIAQALYNELSGEFVQADAVADGNPLIRPGRVVKLTGMGKYSGKYYVTETRHIFDAGVYTTEFSVRGLREGDSFLITSSRTHLQPGQTLMVGIVTNNKDPKKWGRVRVKLPTLTEEHETDWARVITIGAGPTRGFDCLPEVNDEVLVGFEHGDIQRPFVLGNVWNGTDAPPTSVDDSIDGSGKVRLRTFKTRTGHTLQFVEDDKDSVKKGVYVKTVYGHQFNMNDADKYIELKTNNGHYLKMDDQNKSLELKGKNGNLCKIDDQGNKITIDSKGEIEIKASQKITLKVNSNTIEITASGINLTVGGTKIELSNSNAVMKMGANKVDISAMGIDVNSTGLATVKGTTTTVKGDMAVSVSALSVSLG